MDRPVRVLRVIARMNVGGPAHHVSILAGRLDRLGYETLLISGRVGAGEGSAQDLARRRGARLKVVEHLAPEIRPIADLRALLRLVRVVRSFRPDVVHTHTAKAGFLGRLAASLAVRPRPKVVHTYHGHVLEGYFGRTKTELYRTLERAAARVSDVLVGVSRATVDDLVRLGVAPATRFRVVPLGLELDAFLELDPVPDPSAPLRRECGAQPGDVVAVFVGRLAPIKRVDIALEAVAAARAAGAPLRLVVVGDGELRPQLEAQAERLGLGPFVHFAGFREDMAQVVAAADLALLTSDNEGTPVAVIEAAAGARSAVATEVGGVATVLPDGAGRRCPRRDAKAIAAALIELAGDAELRLSFGRTARAHAAERFGADRLVADIDALYRSLLESEEAG